MLDELWASMDAAWLLDFMTDLLLVAFTVGVGGFVLARLQEKWAADRGRAEAIWEHQKELYLRAAKVWKELLEVRGLVQAASREANIQIRDELLNAARARVTEVCVEGAALTTEMELAYGADPGVFGQLQVLMGVCDGVEGIPEKDGLDAAIAGARSLVKELRERMRYGAQIDRED